MPIGMYFMVRICVHAYIRRGLQCCLFGSKGNARASDSGTAIVQSRFFVLLIIAIIQRSKPKIRRRVGKNFIFIMKHYYFDFEGGSEVSIPAESESEAWEKCRRMYPNSTVIKVWNA